MSQSLEHVIHSIEQLSPFEQDKLFEWLEEKKKQSHADSSEDWREKAERSNGSLHWLDEHRAEYLGQRVALEGSHLIASGATAKEVYAAAKAAGVRVPFVELVTERETRFAALRQSLGRASIEEARRALAEREDVQPESDLDSRAVITLRSKMMT